jgi:hypothetical protein
MQHKLGAKPQAVAASSLTRLATPSKASHTVKGLSHSTNRRNIGTQERAYGDASKQSTTRLASSWGCKESVVSVSESRAVDHTSGRNGRSAERRAGVHLVFTLHGIRTYGDWQERLQRLTLEEAERRGTSDQIEFCHYKYGIFSVLALWFPPTRWLTAKRFRKEYEARLAEFRDVRRIDVFAHSFGTYVATLGLRWGSSPPGPKVTNLVLAGSVLPMNFDWSRMISRRVERVVNECGWKDGILVLNSLVNPFLGAAGRLGFRTTEYRRLIQRHYPFGHSDYFAPPQPGDHVDSFLRARWVPLAFASLQHDIEPGHRRPALTPLRTLFQFLIANSTLFKVGLLLSLLWASFVYGASFYISRKAATSRQLELRAQAELQAPLTSQDAALVAALASEAQRHRPISAWMSLLLPGANVNSGSLLAHNALQRLHIVTFSKLDVDLGNNLSSFRMSPDGRFFATQTSERSLVLHKFANVPYPAPGLEGG